MEIFEHWRMVNLRERKNYQKIEEELKEVKG
jgi:hypothetical protein